MDDKLVKIATFDDSLRAHLMRTRLEEADIFVEIRDDKLVQADPLLANAVGGVKLFVLESQLQRALEIIADERDGSLKGGIPDAASGLRCPECGDRVIQFGRLFHVWLGTVILLFVLPFLAPAEGVLGAYRGPVLILGATIAFVGFWGAVLRKFPLECSECSHSGARSVFEPTPDDLDDDEVI